MRHIERLKKIVYFRDKMRIYYFICDMVKMHARKLNENNFEMREC